MFAESRGGIRIHMNRDGKYGTIEMAIKPTAEQKKKLRSFINAVGGNVDIDFMDENYNTTHAVSYEGVSPTRALSGITTFYDKGIKPKGNESYSLSKDEIVSIAESEGTVSYSLVKDEAKIAELEASPKRIGYRNMVLNEDGTLSAPMASSLSYPSRKKDTEVKMAVSELGKWEQADEHPELVNDKGKVTIYQPENGAGTTVNYDPYIHSRQDRVNTQLKGAWRRPNLVYVEVEIPTPDLESGYQADKAALPVGAHEWAGGSGIVMLSMYDKPVRIADWNDVADDWMKRFGNEPIHFDIIPPQLLPILAERGANISSPHTGLGVDVYKAYDKFKEEQGVSYSLDRYNKRTIEKGFGGIWIADRQEFAKFASAVKTTPHEEDGEGIAFTDNYFYAYYRNIDGQPIPFASVYMNRYESQDVVNRILKDIHDGEIRDVREWFSWFNEVTRNVQSENDAIVGIDKDSSSPRRNGKMGGKLSRIGSYYDRPDLYVKTSRVNINDYDDVETTNYSLNRTDIDYLDAVNRGDMAQAQNDDIRYSINRDEVTIATPEMVAEANEELSREAELVEQLDEAQTALDRLRSKIDKRNQRKEMTFDEVRKLLLDDYFRPIFHF